MPTEWTTIVNTTTQQYLTQVEINILRQRKLLALLREKGQIVYNDFGRFLDWKVRYKRAPLVGFADGDTLTFARRDRYKTAQLDWRAYVLTDMQSKMDRLKNRSKAAIIELYSTIVDDMVEEIEEQFCDELYGNGVTGGPRKLHGIESFMSDGGAISGSVARSPNSTYAGLSCALGNYGGTLTGTWPNGTADSQYDFWSPLLIDYTNTTGWGGSSHTWTTHGLQAIRYALIKGRKFKSKKGMMDMGLLHEDMYGDLLNVVDDKEQINVNRGQKSALVSLGFEDVINIDGCDFTWEYGTAAEVGYIFNTMQMQLRSMQPKLFVPVGPVFNEETQSYRFTIDFYGNARFNPRAFAKLDSYS